MSLGTGAGLSKTLERRLVEEARDSEIGHDVDVSMSSMYSFDRSYGNTKPPKFIRFENSESEESM